MQYKYFYTKRTAAKIRSFYRNVAKKYRHTYSYENMERNVRDAFFAIYAIEDAATPPSHHQPMGGLPHGKHRQVVLRLHHQGRHDYRC